MSLLERIKATIFGENVPPQAPADAAEDGRWLGTEQSTTGYHPDVATPAEDPVLDDLASYGAQPLSKPTEILRAQNPEHRPADRRD